MIDKLSLAAESEKVLQQLMDNGSFDELRKQVMEELKGHETLRQFTSKLLDESSTIEALDMSNANKKRLLDDLRHELGDKLLEKANEVAWQVLNEGAMSRAIDERVHQALEDRSQQNRHRREGER